MQVIEVPTLKGNTPARVNRKTGTIFLNMSIFKDLPDIYKKFILYHEECHFIFQTQDEEMCDEYAMHKLLRAGEKPKKIVDVLIKTLSDNNLHYARKINLTNNMRIYDYLYNGNKNALKSL